MQTGSSSAHFVDIDKTELRLRFSMYAHKSVGPLRIIVILGIILYV